MLNKTKESQASAASFIAQAIDFLEKNNFEGFLQQLGHLGTWLQKGHPFPRRSFSLTPQQTLAFQIVQNAWHDQHLARIKHLDIVSACDNKTPALPNSCLLLRLPEEPYWKIIPVNASGEKLDPLDLAAMDDVMELTQKLPVRLIDLDPQEYSQEEQALVSRLKRALKRANPATLAQNHLSAKAALSKASRHRLKLGLDAFKSSCRPTKDLALSEEPPPGLHLVILDQEPCEASWNNFEPNTYVVLRPRKGQKGRIWFYRSAHSKKQELRKKPFPALLSEEQLFLMPEDEAFQKKRQHAFDDKIKNCLLAYHCHQLDEQAQNAIRHYKTRWEKIIRGFEYSLAALTAFVYGAVEMTATMVGFFVAAGIVWTNPWLAILGGLLIAGAVIFPFPSTWANWKVFATYLPDFFDKIGAEYREINSKAKKGFFWLLALLALATGIASGGLAYTATIALPAMLGLSTIGFIFPPLGVIFASAILLTQTFSLLRNFTTLLRKENSWKSFLKPFQEVKKFLHDHHASRSRQLITWIMIGGLTLLALVGLMMSCFTSTRSVGKLFIDQLRLAPQKALACGIAIGAVSSFFSRVYLTVSSALSSAVTVCKQLFSNNASAKAKTDKPRNSLSLSLKKWAAILIDSTLGAAFYAWSIVSLNQRTATELEHDIDLHLSNLSPGSTAALATGAFLTSKARYVTLYLHHAMKPDNPYEAVTQTAADQRLKKNLAFYRENNPHSLFVQTKETKGEEQHYASLSSASFTRT